MNIKLSLLITLVVCGIINATTDKTTIRDQIEKTRTQLQKNHAAAQTRHIEMSLWLNIATCILRDQRHHEDDKKGLVICSDECAEAMRRFVCNSVPENSVLILRAIRNVEEEVKRLSNTMK